MQKGYAIRTFWVRRLFRVHTLALFTILGVYFVFAFLDPGLLSYDLRQKFRALADDIVITATVLGPPAQPVVTASASCDETTGTLSVELDWADDANTYTYDIDRDSAPLVSGLAVSLYNDTNVTVATTYQYEVTGNGPMGPGSATSLPVSVTTPSECEITASVPAVTIVSLAGRNIDSYNGTPRIESRRPIFSGTTSMPNATMLLIIGTSFIAEFSANSNGYWEWQPPYGVSSGSHTFTVTATDPGNSTRQATASLRFDILKRGDTETSGGSGSGSEGDVPVNQNDADGQNASVEPKPATFTLTLGGSGRSVYQGRDLEIFLTIHDLLEKYMHISIPIRYSLTDEEYEIIFTQTRDTYITEGAIIKESVPIPSYLMPGRYLLQIEMLFDGLSVSRTLPVLVEELPLIQLSSGDTVSYADIIRHLGWVVFFSLLLLLLWLFLFLREFVMYLRGDGGVTEYDFKRAGYFRK